MYSYRLADANRDLGGSSARRPPDSVTINTNAFYFGAYFLFGFYWPRLKSYFRNPFLAGTDAVVDKCFGLAAINRAGSAGLQATAGMDGRAVYRCCSRTGSSREDCRFRRVPENCREVMRGGGLTASVRLRR